MKRINIFLVSLRYLLCVIPVLCVAQPKLNQDLYFDEPKLEKAIALQVGVEVRNLTSTHIRERLKYFELNDAKIRSLKGLEHASNLEVLILKNNLLTDLGPIAKLPKIKKLDLSGNKISNLGSLLFLTHKSVENRISEIRDSLGTTKTLDNEKANLLLEMTSLSGKELFANSSLEELNLSKNRLVGLSGIEHFVRLRTLNASYNSLIDLDGVGKLKSLISLHLQGNQLGIPESFEDLNKNKMYDMGEPFSDLSGNGKWDYDPLVEFNSTIQSLRNLYLYDNHISKLDSLGDFPNLSVLLLSGNKLNDLDGIETIRSLQKLHLNNNQISNLNGLQNLVNLTQLFLSENRICDIRALSKLSRLQSLHLQYNHIEDAASLKNLSGLKELRLSNNLIHEISFLDGLSNLKLLYISSNSLSSPVNLEGLEKLSSQNSLEFILFKEQRNRIESLENLVRTLSSSPNLNELFGKYLQNNGYDRFSDFLNTASVPIVEKKEYFVKWESILNRGGNLSDSGFSDK